MKLSKTFSKSLHFTLSLGLISLINLSGSPSRANDLQTILSGREIPLNLSLKNLDSSWRKITMTGQFEMASFMKTWSSFLGGSGYDYVFYTQGKTVTIGSKTYLIAYHFPFIGKPMNFSSIFKSVLLGDCSEEGFPKKLTADTLVNLALLNLDTIGSLNDITAVNINQEITDSIQKYDAAVKACQENKNNPLNPESNPETSPEETEDHSP